MYGELKCPEPSCTFVHSPLNHHRNFHDHVDDTGHPFPPIEDCTLCGASFLDERTLNGHLRDAHGDVDAALSVPLPSSVSGDDTLLTPILDGGALLDGKDPSTRAASPVGGGPVEVVVPAEVCCSPSHGHHEPRAQEVVVDVPRQQELHLVTPGVSSSTTTPINTPFKCVTCWADYGGKKSLVRHWRNTNHVITWCRFCSAFYDPSFILQHNATLHTSCPQCGLVLADFDGLLEHCSSNRHVAYVCNSCREAFDSLPSLETHFNSAGHIGRFPLRVFRNRGYEQYWCGTCNRQFSSREGLQQHLLNAAKHNWCADCQQDFPSRRKRKEHRRLGQCTGKGGGFVCGLCEREFGSTSALAQHLESGVHGVSRKQITAAVYSMGIIPSITTRAIAYDSGSSASFTHARVGSSSWTGTGYACPVCNKEFKTVDRVNAHLSSPVHDDPQFHCPQVKCDKDFKVVSGFIQHLESGSCGLTTAGEIEHQFRSLTGQFSRALRM